MFLFHLQTETFEIIEQLNIVPPLLLTIYYSSM